MSRYLDKKGLPGSTVTHDELFNIDNAIEKLEKIRTTQVKVWLEVCPFDKEIVLRLDSNNLEMANECTKIITDFVKPFRNERILKDGESQESIISALWKLQIKLMGEEGLKFGSLVYIDPFEIEYYYKKQRYTFYNPTTQIITITRWDKEG